MADLDGSSAASSCDDDGGGAPDTGSSGAPSNATYVTLSASTGLSAERVLTAGTGISIVDGGANGPVTISATGSGGAPTDAQYVVLALNGTLTAERALAVTSGHLSLTDGGANGNVTLGLAAAGTAGTYAYPSSVTTDAQGRVTAITAGSTPALASVTLTAGAGLTGGGDLSASRTFNVAAADSTITVNADSIQVGEITNTNVAAAAAIAHSKLANLTNTSVLGSAAGGSAPSEIAATTNGHALRRAGGVLGFGTLATGAFAGTATDGNNLTIVSGVPTWTVPTGGVTDHGALTGLSDDDHTIYALLAGRSGGQSWIAGTGSGDNMDLSASSHGTPGKIRLGGSSGFIYDQLTNFAGLGGTPASEFHVQKSFSNNSVIANVENLSSSGASEALIWAETNATGGGAGFQLVCPSGVGVTLYAHGHTKAGNLWTSGPTAAGSVDLRKANAGVGTLAVSTRNSAEDILLAANTGSSGGAAVLRLTSAGNYQFGGSAATAPSFQSGVGVIHVTNRGTAPTAAPASGFFLYAGSGSATFVDSTGTTVII
jgi:hypothetical protein